VPFRRGPRPLLNAQRQVNAARAPTEDPAKAPWPPSALDAIRRPVGTRALLPFASLALDRRVEDDRLSVRDGLDFLAYEGVEGIDAGAFLGFFQRSALCKRPDLVGGRPLADDDNLVRVVHRSVQPVAGGT
jgi:hypothetical protein